MNYVVWLGMTMVFSVSIAYAEPLKDPTQPPAILNEKVGEMQPLSLNAIIISPNRRIAIINDTILKVGQDVYGNKIVAINPNSVQLDGVNGKITLFLSGNPIKQLIKQLR